MDCAAYKGWDRTVQLLIEFEADIDPKDKAGVRERERDKERKREGGGEREGTGERRGRREG